jgi:hypothetical protein
MHFIIFAFDWKLFYQKMLIIMNLKKKKDVNHYGYMEL